MMVALLFFLLVQISTVLKVSGECSVFQITEQPPSELTCNPYDTTVSEPVWRFRTVCEVQRISGSDSFEIHWFHRDLMGNIEDLERPDFYTGNSMGQRAAFGNQWTNQVFTESMLGDYWCQVIVTSTQPDTHLGRGNTFTIEEPGYYDNELLTCSGSISVLETVCADEPSTSTTISSPITSMTTTIVTMTTGVTMTTSTSSNIQTSATTSQSTHISSTTTTTYSSILLPSTVTNSISKISVSIPSLSSSSSTSHSISVSSSSSDYTPKSSPYILSTPSSENPHNSISSSQSLNNITNTLNISSTTVLLLGDWISSSQPHNNITNTLYISSTTALLVTPGSKPRLKQANNMIMIISVTIPSFLLLFLSISICLIIMILKKKQTKDRTVTTRAPELAKISKLDYINPDSMYSNPTYSVLNIDKKTTSTYTEIDGHYIIHNTNRDSTDTTPVHQHTKDNGISGPQTKREISPSDIRKIALHNYSNDNFRVASPSSMNSRNPLLGSSDCIDDINRQNATGYINIPPHCESYVNVHEHVTRESPHSEGYANPHVYEQVTRESPCHEGYANLHVHEQSTSSIEESPHHESYANLHVQTKRDTENPLRREGYDNNHQQIDPRNYTNVHHQNSKGIEGYSHLFTGATNVPQPAVDPMTEDYAHLHVHERSTSSIEESPHHESYANLHVQTKRDTDISLRHEGYANYHQQIDPRNYTNVHHQITKGIEGYSHLFTGATNVPQPAVNPMTEDYAHLYVHNSSKETQ